MSAAPIIEVRNAQRKLRVDVGALERFASAAWQACCELPGATLDRVNALSDISVVLVSDRRMAELHRRFMSIQGPTDVITFQHGEVVISVETARANARRFGSSGHDEIRLYMVHGFLHLLGFDDKTAGEARVMEAAQKRVIRMLRASRAG